MSEQCTTCFHSDETIVSARAVTRTQALTRFLQLQGDGYAPAMCEGHGGCYTVCFNAAQRPMVTHWLRDSGLPAVDRRP